MNYFLLCVAFFVGVQASLLSPEEKAKIKEVQEVCMKETLVDPELVTKAKNGEYVEDDKLKEQILCFTKKVGFQDSNGKWQMDKIKERLMNIVKDASMVETITQKCIRDMDKPNQAAFEAVKCLHQMAPKDELIFD